MEESVSKRPEMDGNGSSNSDDENYENNRRVRRARSFRERPEKSSGELRMVRSFKTTSKGLVNRGDSFKKLKDATEIFVAQSQPEENMKNLSLDAFVVVFSTTDRISFDQAIEVLKQLREEVGAHKAIIPVGNKSDHARKRTIPSDGRSAADGYECKYIETSAALNHLVDELLVGIHKQTMLKCHAINNNALETPPTKQKQKHRTSSFKRTKRFLEIFLGNSGKDKTTENLYVE
ncbi:GTP-binding protein RAD-like [Dreissena polymorpha]|uniref:GTP-binding protein RAD-like n=1 Tax=Dreissena polymorpha TaxID=45954 RepID=UPI002264A666|nr:GTP-binding protein RAD-like [Dreissena polymorpha]